MQDIRSSIRFRPINEKIKEYIDRSITAYEKDVCDESDGDDETHNETEEAGDGFEGDTQEQKVGEGEYLTAEDIIHPTWANDNVVEDFKFGKVEFELLVDKLPRGIRNLKIKYELLNGFLRIRTIPGHVHGGATGYFVDTVVLWSSNQNGTGLAARPLRNFTDASKAPFLPHICLP